MMELVDCAFPLLTECVCTSEMSVAFDLADVVIFLGAMPRKEGMERKDLLDKNAGIFKEQGIALQKYASPHVKSLVVGNPANTNCAALIASAPQLDAHNFSALTRLDQNRATAQIAQKFNVQNEQVKNVLIWGNHSATQVPDVAIATIVEQSGIPRPVRLPSGADDAWLDNEFVSIIQTRGAAVIKKRGSSSAMSAAKAISDHLRDWLLGTNAGRCVSMAVPSDGSYNVPIGLVFSFPVVCSAGSWQIVKNVPISDAVAKRMQITKEELLMEQKTAFTMLGIATPSSAL